MNKHLLALASLILVSSASADDIYGGLGVPGIATVGYTKHLSQAWNVRVELSGGTDWKERGNYEGVEADLRVKSNRVGVYGDWFPFEAAPFRLVGGLTVNDTRAKLNATGRGTVTIGDAVNVDLGQDFYRVKLEQPSITPYLGLGYGHRSTSLPGLGFYADIGLMAGTMKVSSETSLVGKLDGTGRAITQADVDQQSRKIRDSVARLKALPVASVGLTYRF